MIRKLFSMMALALMITAGAAAQGNVDTKDYDWARYGCYASDNAKLEKRPLVVLMGDSITEGFNAGSTIINQRNNQINKNA